MIIISRKRDVRILSLVRRIGISRLMAKPVHNIEFEVARLLEKVGVLSAMIIIANIVKILRGRE